MSRDPARRFGSVRKLAESLLPFATRVVAERWSDEFVTVPSEARLREGRVPSLLAVREARDDLRAATIETRDGVAVSSRGDTLIMVWQSAARLPRTRWAFDRIDRFAAGKDGGILVLMIVLPSADPRPTPAARLEHERRTRILAHRIRRFANASSSATRSGRCSSGASFARWSCRTRQLSGGTTTVDFTVEAGITANASSVPGPRTPPFARIFSDVQALYAALGEAPPVPRDRPPEPEPESTFALRGGGRKSA